ncbi:MAG TPA: tetratricopeptide repeat protein [Bacteroidia bacterium]|nr:tetratricopeptide repeat protein [Bacteroidia bacterium]
MKKLLTYTVVVTVVIANLFCNYTTTPALERTEFVSLTDSIHYAGMNSCKECHQSIYDSYIQTGMGKSFEKASKKKSSADFSNSKIYDKFKDLYYQSFWNGDSLQFMEYRLYKGDTIHKRIETVHYIVGSGQHTNSHMVVTNGYFNQAPMTFYTQKKKWDFPPGFEDGHNTRFNRLIGLECMTCHNSYPEFVEGSVNKFESVPEGISCERCHGPGSAHVAEKQAGKLVDISQKIDYSIVNPAKLSIEKQFDICQRCHVQGNAVLRKGKSFYDFLPGMKLSDVMNVFMPVYSNSSEHIMASHAERLKLSQCYLQTTQKISADKNLSNQLRPYKNALTCVTCHNPHISVKSTGIDHFNNTCKNCHSEGKSMKCSADKKLLESKQNNCVSCHMPKSGATDIPHVSVTEHFIRKPISEKEFSAIKNFVTISCINNPNVEQLERGRAYISYCEKFELGQMALDSAKKIFNDQTPDEIKQNFEELIHIAYLEKNAGNIIRYLNAVPDAIKTLNKKSFENTDAWTCYRIAQMIEVNQPGRAEVFYKRCIELAPYHIDFLNKYGNILVTLNKQNEAKDVFAKAVSLYPKNAQSLSNLGYLTLLTEGDAEKAISFYNRAIALDPDYEKAFINKAGALVYQNKINDAKAVLFFFLLHHKDAVESKEVMKRLKDA